MAFPNLDDSARDANLMAKTFSKLGIAVHGGGASLNLTGDQMVEEVDAFADTLRPGDEAFFFFSGHGIQLEGLNYLIPSDFDAKTESLAKRKAVDLYEQLEKLEQRNCRLVVMFLDCCRDTPSFITGEASKKSLNKGLAEMKVDTSGSTEIMVCFSTMHGKVSWTSPNGTTSAFTTALAEEIQRPAELSSVMKAVGRRVREDTKDEEQPQTPAIYGNLLNDYFLAGLPRSGGMDGLPQTSAFNSNTIQESVSSRLQRASKSDPFVNSLGMRFVPVEGTNVLFSVWETRVSDFMSFSENSSSRVSTDATVIVHSDSEPIKLFEGRPDLAYRACGFPQGPDHPVVCVTPENARAFCDWLSKKEGVIYRLPSDAEWSCAAGLDESKNVLLSPAEKSVTFALQGIQSVPPGSDVGNLLGKEASGKFYNIQSRTVMSPFSSHMDAYVFTAPVGTYPPNLNGIFDIFGNVKELTISIYNPSLPESHQDNGYSVRGSSFRTNELNGVSLSTRTALQRGQGFYEFGFRVVIESPSVR
ncbi:MAG: SUMF1/EgtB/PvdO family nonheme iron enzyme [Verrucomicrobiae bacterium]|nr:SUMF1/EgtB/PvdO family nonheme iron enzyme [Verrucomicrobiae bacterium]